MIPKNDLPNFADDLVRIHKVITRGLTITTQRGTQFMKDGFPDATTRQGFADYVQALAAVLSAHHLSEDEIAFPALKVKLPKAPYTRLAADHKFIESSLVTVRQLINDLEKGSSMMGWGLVIEGLKKDFTAWTPHILLEETFFSKDAIADAMTPDEQAQLSISMSKYSQEHAGPPYLVLPFVLFNLAPEDRAAITETMPKQVMEDLFSKAGKERWEAMKPFLLE